jgi:hypothetical protein
VVLCLRERFQAGRITGLADERTISQLAQIRYRPNSRGQIVIESKEELLRRGVKSPDRADSVMLAFAKRHDPGAAFIENAFRYLERKSNPTRPDQTAALVRNGNPVIEEYNRKLGEYQNRLVRITERRDSSEGSQQLRTSTSRWLW